MDPLHKKILYRRIVSPFFRPSVDKSVCRPICPSASDIYLYIHEKHNGCIVVCLSNLLSMLWMKDRLAIRAWLFSGTNTRNIFGSFHCVKKTQRYFVYLGLNIPFVDASQHLYNKVYPSESLSVRPSVRLSTKQGKCVIFNLLVHGVCLICDDIL